MHFQRITNSVINVIEAYDGDVLAEPFVMRVLVLSVGVFEVFAAALLDYVGIWVILGVGNSGHQGPLHRLFWPEKNKEEPGPRKSSLLSEIWDVIWYLFWWPAMLSIQQLRSGFNFESSTNVGRLAFLVVASLQLVIPCRIYYEHPWLSLFGFAAHENIMGWLGNACCRKIYGYWGEVDVSWRI